MSQMSQESTKDEAKSLSRDIDTQFTAAISSKDASAVKQILDTLRTEDRNELIKKYFYLAVQSKHIATVEQMFEVSPHLATDLICQGINEDEESDEEVDSSKVPLLQACYDLPMLNLLLTKGDKQRLLTALNAPCSIKEYSENSIFFIVCYEWKEIDIRVFQRLLKFLGPQHSFLALSKQQSRNFELEDDGSPLAALIGGGQLPWIRLAFAAIDKSHHMELITSPKLGYDIQSNLVFAAFHDQVEILKYFMWEFPEILGQLLTAVITPSKHFVSPIEQALDNDSVAAFSFLLEELARNESPPALKPLVLRAAAIGQCRILEVLFKGKEPSAVSELIKAPGSIAGSLSPFEKAISNRRYNAVVLMLKSLTAQDAREMFAKVDFSALIAMVKPRPMMGDSDQEFDTVKSRGRDLLEIAFLATSYLHEPGYEEVLIRVCAQAFVLAGKIGMEFSSISPYLAKMNELMHEAYARLEDAASHSRSSPAPALSAFDGELLGFRAEARRREDKLSSTSSASSSAPVKRKREDDRLNNPPGQPAPRSRH